MGFSSPDCAKLRIPLYSKNRREGSNPNVKAQVIS